MYVYPPLGCVCVRGVGLNMFTVYNNPNISTSGCTGVHDSWDIGCIYSHNHAFVVPPKLANVLVTYIPPVMTDSRTVVQCIQISAQHTHTHYLRANGYLSMPMAHHKDPNINKDENSVSATIRPSECVGRMWSTRPTCLHMCVEVGMDDLWEAGVGGRTIPLYAHTTLLQWGRGSCSHLCTH
jgi:hypothetical protein